MYIYIYLLDIGVKKVSLIDIMMRYHPESVTAKCDGTWDLGLVVREKEVGVEVDYR